MIGLRTLLNVVLVTGVGGGAIFLGFTGCGGDDDAAPGSARVPEEPNAPVLNPARHTFAIQDFLLGDTTRDGRPDESAWRTFGYDLDQKATTRNSTDVCTALVRSVQVDGDQGIDNSFGLNLLPLLNQPDSGVLALNDRVHAGEFTLLIDTEGLTGDPKQTNSGLTGQIFGGAIFGGRPTFTTADDWPVTADLLVNGTVEGGSRVKFEKAYISDGKFVGAVDPLIMQLQLGGLALQLTLHKAIVSFDYRNGTTAENGTIAGVTGANELVESVRKIRGQLDPRYCDEAAFRDLIVLVTKAADILVDGTNRPGVDCDAISVGLGFTAKEIRPPSRVGDAGPAAPDNCMPDGGMPDGG